MFIATVFDSYFFDDDEISPDTKASPEKPQSGDQCPQAFLVCRTMGEGEKGSLLSCILFVLPSAGSALA
jgi:hypothetical protein